MDYVYLVASLPGLELTAPPVISSDELLASTAGVLRPDHREDLRAVLEDRPQDLRSRAAGPYVDAETQLRNALAQARASRAGRRHDARPHGGFEMRAVAVAERAMELDDPAARELMLDRFRWRLLDELSFSPPFGFQAVLAYAFKLRLAEKWAAMDETRGLAMASGLVEEALAGSVP